jgi:hypothetical protein
LLNDHFGVGRRLEQTAAPDQLAPQRARIGQIAVMGDGEAARFEIGEQRLDIAQHGVAACRVPVVAHRRGTGQAADDVLAAEILPDLAERAMTVKLMAVEGDDTGGFLAPMLQCMQAERGQRGGIDVTVNAEDSAFLARFVFTQRNFDCQSPTPPQY